MRVSGRRSDAICGAAPARVAGTRARAAACRTASPMVRIRARSGRVSFVSASARAGILLRDGTSAD